MEHTLPENIRIVSDFDSGGFPVQVDLTQMQQVVTNLAVNAGHAMRDGGELTFGLSQTHVGPTERPPLPGMGHDDWIALRVADTGTGKPDEVVVHIFEPFYTTKKSGEGTGLGLAQVYGIVKQHDGEIEVATELGTGTTFTLYFPKTAKGKDLALTKEINISKGQGETILLVENRPEVLDIAKEIFEQLNYSVVPAKNGKDALALYEADPDKVSAVLTKMVISEMGGLELIQELRSRNPAIKSVVMTGYPLGEKIWTDFRLISQVP